MTDDRTPHEATDPYEDALVTRLEQAAAGIDGDGVSRDGVRRAAAARGRDQRRRRTALVGVAAAVALLGGAAVAGTIGGDDTRVSTDDRADAPTPEPTCPADVVVVDGGSFTGQGVEIDPETAPPGSVLGDAATFGDQEPVTTLSEEELQSAATLLQVFDQVDRDAYLAFVTALSSDFTASPERQAFAQAVRALHPYTGPDDETAPDGPQRRAVDEYAATLPDEVVEADLGSMPFSQAELDAAVALLRPLGISETGYRFEIDRSEVNLDFLALVRSGAAPDAAGSYGRLTEDQLAVLDAYVAELPDDLFVNGKRLPRPPTGPGVLGDSTETTAPDDPGDPNEQSAPAPILPGGVRCGQTEDGDATTQPESVTEHRNSDTTAVAGPGAQPTTTDGSSTPDGPGTDGSAGDDLDAAAPFGTLRIDAIGVEAPVLLQDGSAVGKTAVLVLPDSPSPGERGNSVIAGSRATDGNAFLRLDELAVGDEVELVRHDGVVLTFRVDVGVTRFPEAEQGERLAGLADQAEPRLTLLTYAPVYSVAERLLVSAVLESEEPASDDGLN